ncbi:MAG TPA: class I SAM-dependent methyltransferase [Polyangiaceae bacterium]|nr:class I SAM-dependent methyltransferase [Polyangiaceae bacterium]
MKPLQRLLGMPPISRAARRAADYVDLQWSLTISALKRVAPQAHGRLIDVGCGHKPYVDIFTPYVDEYIGVEREDTFAHTNAQVQGEADVIYDGERLPFPDASFDTALNVQVLEHTPAPLELLTEIARVLKPGGLLILMAPFSFRLHEEPHDYFRYSPYGLRHLCERAGLDMCSVEPMGALWSVMGHKLNSYLGLSVARMGGVAQSLQKLGHEPTKQQSPRFWTLPIVVPAMFWVETSSRVLDRIIPDSAETLSFIATAKRRA